MEVSFFLWPILIFASLILIVVAAFVASGGGEYSKMSVSNLLSSETRWVNRRHDLLRAGLSYDDDLVKEATNHLASIRKALKERKHS